MADLVTNDGWEAELAVNDGWEAELVANDDGWEAELVVGGDRGGSSLSVTFSLEVDLALSVSSCE